VHRAAEALGLTVRTPARLKRDAAEHAAFAALDLDAAVVAAYGLILPEAMLQAPRRGCLNIHASLLPRWRGAAPIQAAILAGDARTGITVMQMDAGLDTGPMLLDAAVPIGPDTTAAGLHDALADLGARLVVQALDRPPVARAQPEQGATYAPKLTRQDGLIDWSRDAGLVDRQIRALNPWPGTFTLAGGATLKVLAGVPVGGAGEPGTVLDDRLTVACGGQGAMRLLRVQAPGGAAMDAADFLRGHRLPPGTRLGVGG
jgi:methionyl-tRNA formyltransferase